MNQTRLHRWSWKRATLVVLAIVICLLVVVATRWYVAQQRVADVAQRAAHTSTEQSRASITASQTANASNVGRATYKLPESAGRATLHLHAIDSYEARKASDLAALPPPGEPLTKERFAQLTKLADDGNARAACVLGQNVSKCSF
jgi:type II secretory pathway pseudopilin PulG